MSTTRFTTPSKDTETLVQCVKCSPVTAHQVHATIEHFGDEAEGAYYWRNVHQLVQCLGCKSISYRIASSNSEETFCNPDGEEEPIISEKLYPPRDGVTTGIFEGGE